LFAFCCSPSPNPRPQALPKSESVRVSPTFERHESTNPAPSRTLVAPFKSKNHEPCSPRSVPTKRSNPAPSHPTRSGESQEMINFWQDTAGFNHLHLGSCRVTTH
jgi:hypothetical protein